MYKYNMLLWLRTFGELAESHTEKSINIQPLIEVNLVWEKIPHQEIIILNKTMCAAIIGSPRNSYEQNKSWSDCLQTFKQ